MKAKDPVPAAQGRTGMDEPEEDPKTRRRGDDGATLVVINPTPTDSGKPRGGGDGKGSR